jgi:hypothetical protein
MKKHSTTTKRTRSKAAIGFLGAAICGLLPATAYAATSTGGSNVATTSSSTAGSESHPQCTPTDLPAAKVYVEGLLQERVATLGALTAQVSRARGVTESDKAELQSDLANDLAAMLSLKQQVGSDTTCTALVANAQTMVFDYRVYLVMTPQAELVIVSDTESAIASAGVRWEPGIQAAITYAGNHGKDVTGAQQAFDDLKVQLTDALGTLQGVTATVLAQTPAGSPGNHSVFVAARDKCQSVFGDLHNARQDLAMILSAL